MWFRRSSVHIVTSLRCGRTWFDSHNCGENVLLFDSSFLSFNAIARIQYVLVFLQRGKYPSKVEVNGTSPSSAARECVEVNLYCTLHNFGIYLIIARSQSNLHQFQAVILEYSPSVATLNSPLKPRGNFKYLNLLNLKTTKFHQAYLAVSYDPQNKDILFSYTAIVGFLFQHR